MDIRAALFDIDGTLVDSNYLHIDAWSRAFDDVGQPVDAWRIHRSIGMDGEKLLDALLKSKDNALRKRAQDRHSEHYARSAERLRPFEGARELLRALADAGLTVVLATSAPESELAALRAALEIEDAVDVVTSSEDVETAKPAPDIVKVALERAAVPASDAVMVGDSVWDMEAAVAAGVMCVGVRSGGVSADELRDAGAAAVYSDVADLLAHLGDSVFSSTRA
jgi:HAD superfamily hydrolase (TIGR01509 family)